MRKFCFSWYWYKWVVYLISYCRGSSIYLGRYLRSVCGLFVIKPRNDTFYWLFPKIDEKQKNSWFLQFLSYRYVIWSYVVHIWMCLFLPVLIMTDFIFIFIYLGIYIYLIVWNKTKITVWFVIVLLSMLFASFCCIVNTKYMYCTCTVYVLFKIIILAEEITNKIEHVILI